MPYFAPPLAAGNSVVLKPSEKSPLSALRLAALANDTRYGLATSVWTANLTTAHETARRLQTGTVW